MSVLFCGASPLKLDTNLLGKRKCSYVFYYSCLKQPITNTFKYSIGYVMEAVRIFYGNGERYDVAFISAGVFMVLQIEFQYLVMKTSLSNV